MKLDLSEIVRHIGMESTEEIDERCVPEELGFECAGPVKGCIKLSNTGTLLLISGSVKTEVRLQCSRCVGEFIVPVEAPIEEEFQIAPVGDFIKALPMDEDDASADLISDNILDVHELIRQNILVALPFQPLCKENCKGLCPTCGENLNVRECDCSPATSGSPFEVLKDLLDEEDKK